MSLLITLLLDLLFGDRPDRFLLISWMGRLMALFTRVRAYGRPLAELPFGIALTLSRVAQFAGGGFLLIPLLHHYLCTPIECLATRMILEATTPVLRDGYQ